MEAGHSVSVFNRSEDKTRDLVKKGARACASPLEVARNSDVIFSIVGFPADVESVILGGDGVLEGLESGDIVVDMTTSEPSLAKRIDAAVTARGAAALDAPVSGGDVGARDGTLAIMVGGDRETFDAVMPLFKLMGSNIVHMGSAGAGQHTKMSNQVLIATTMIGVVESLLYAYKAGLDLNEVIEVVGSGAASSWAINNLGRRIVKGDFNPGFFIKHFVKDMGIALAESKQMNLALPGLALAHQFYVSAMAVGWEDLGTQGLYKVLARMNDVNA
jgi:3-hydroxyisobutyrate dehydrogenase